VHARTALAAASALAALAALASCGSSGGSQHASGASLFAEDCAMCHSLTGRQLPRRQGGDLLALHTSRAEMLEFVSEMPVAHRMTEAQQQAVADYVRAVEARGP
jgi:mono/diheme cytochrome c family protein